MPHNRFFTPKPFFKNEEIRIQDDEVHHFHVMRVQEKDTIELINGKNQLAEALVISIAKKEVILKIQNVTHGTHVKEKILGLALLRSMKLDLILEKATELGITKFFFFPSQNSEIEELSPNKITRMENILISAIKQCGRLDLPEIHFLKEIKELIRNDFDYFLGEMSAHESIFQISISKKPICILIGPEKGFSSTEILFFQTSLKAKPVKLNDNILRSETAAICAAALLGSLSK